ncbi:MAG: hypothetical protein EXR75_14900 [Myxococcales bacterium]|nr:hypothetical protein [Myxococcales bacterium]
MASHVSACAILLAAALAGCTDPGLGDATSGAAPRACVPAETTCPLVFVYPLAGGVESVELRGDFAPGAWEAGVSLQIDGTEWRAELAAPTGKVIRYKFLLNGKDWVTDPKNPHKESDGLGGENSVRVADCDHEVCAAGVVPEPVVGTFDWRSAVLYFVFVDRFQNGDPTNDAAVGGVEGPANWQGGDWAGVIQKIEDGYFASLGVNALWLTVPMNNTNAAGAGHDGHQYSGYHGYWPSDLGAPEEHFGSLATLKKLVDTAHAHGLKVLFDYAMNHVHADNPLVSQHPDWFWSLDYDGKTCVCGVGCDWNDGYQQRRCWFTSYLPDWNFQNEAARAFSVDNAIAWAKDTGADGFRLDAVKHIETEWLLDLRKRVRAELEPASGEHFYMVGETFESGNRDLIKAYVGQDRLDGQFDFPLRGRVVETLLRRTGTMHDLDGFLATNDAYYPGVMSTFIGNHDISRVIHTAEDKPWGAWDNGDPWGAPPLVPDYAAPFERLAVAFTFLFTTKGVPLIYYGDEIGMAGAGDPDNRRFMQWTGLSEPQSWLREEVAKLGAIRRDHPALWRGTRTTLSVTNDAYAYAMSDGRETVYVALNRGDVPSAVDKMPKKAQDLLTGATFEGPQLTIPARRARILVAE